MLVACEIFGDANMKNIIIGLVAAAAVVGCGGSDEPTDDTSVVTDDTSVMTDDTSVMTDDTAATTTGGTATEGTM
jgi:hypothetical protein